jgi:glycosyltransferase involved in cell wall biosynthesis
LVASVVEYNALRSSAKTGLITTFLVSDIADKLEQLESDENLRIQMGASAKPFATDLFSIKNMVKKYKEIYFTLIK